MRHPALKLASLAWSQRYQYALIFVGYYLTFVADQSVAGFLVMGIAVLTPRVEG
jgi:hypothetical protein